MFSGPSADLSLARLSVSRSRGHAVAWPRSRGAVARVATRPRRRGASRRSMKTDGEIARAVALRAKHALLNADNKRRIMKMPLDLLCISTFNRQGCYPSPRRVQGLMCDLLLKGFSVAEANHEGVVVQELPQDQWQAYERKFSKPYQSFREFNTTNTASVKALEMAFRTERIPAWHAQPLAFGAGLAVPEKRGLLGTIPRTQKPRSGKIADRKGRCVEPISIDRLQPIIGRAFSRRPLSRGAVVAHHYGKARRGRAHIRSSQRSSNTRARNARDGAPQLPGQRGPRTAVSLRPRELRVIQLGGGSLQKNHASGCGPTCIQGHLRLRHKSRRKERRIRAAPFRV